MADRPDHGTGHDGPVPAGQRDRTGGGDPGFGRPRLMAPLPQVEADRRAGRQASGAGFHRANPVGPAEPAGRQAQRDRGGRDDRRGSQIAAGRGVMPHCEPGEVRRRQDAPPGAGVGCGQRQPDGDHRRAAGGGAVQPGGRPAPQPGARHAAGRDQRDRCRRDDQRGRDCEPGQPPGAARCRPDREQADVPADHRPAPGRPRLCWPVPELPGRGRTAGAIAAPGGSVLISILAAAAPRASLALVTVGRAAAEHR